MDLEHFNPPDGDVILIKNSVLDEDGTNLLFSELHQRFPNSVIVALAEGMTFETMEFEELEQLLRDLMAHKEASGG